MKYESNEQYHDSREVSASMLKAMNESWRVFQAKHIHRTLRRDPTISMELGTAVHTAALEPQRFDTDYVVQPDGLGDRRTKAYKEWSANVHHSMTILKREAMETVVQCRDALHRHPVIGPYLKAPGYVERSHYWTCEESSVPCKFRPDKLLPEAAVIVDVKTIQSCSESAFAKSVADFNYHLQAAHYIQGAREKYGNGDWLFMFAVIETSPPFRCRAFHLDSESLDIGFDTRSRLLDEYVRRLNDDDWREPGEEDLISVSLPQWFKRRA